MDNHRPNRPQSDPITKPYPSTRPMSYCQLSVYCTHTINPSKESTVCHCRVYDLTKNAQRMVSFVGNRFSGRHRVVNKSEYKAQESIRGNRPVHNSCHIDACCCACSIPSTTQLTRWHWINFKGLHLQEQVRLALTLFTRHVADN